MTYNELKTRLSVVEKTLKKLQNSKDTKLTPTYIKETVTKLSTLKESIQNKLTLLKEQDGVVRTADAGEAEKLSKKGVNVDLVDKIDENEKDLEFSVNDMREMIAQVGKALSQALVNLGDELARVKAHRLETNSFDIEVIYKGERAGTDDEFAFHVEDGNLHLADFSFNKKLVDIGVKPSGEPFVNVDVLKNELMKHFKSLNEEEVNESPNEKTYIKVKRRDYKEAMSIIDTNIDGNYVKVSDIVDNDGAGNVIIYFDLIGGENSNSYLYDLAMDLKVYDIDIIDHSSNLNSNLFEFIGKAIRKVGNFIKKGVKGASMAAVRGAATGALKAGGVKLEFVGKDLEDRNQPLYDKLVPGMGKADTVEGEMLRAINRMVYRWYNDGDKYFEGYGAETAGPAHAFLVDANHPLKSAMNKILDEPAGDASYERMLNDALDTILDHIESKQGEYTPNNVGDMFDYESYFEDEEEEDEYAYGYDDEYEEDEDYYNEEGLNEEDMGKRREAVKLIRKTLKDEGGAAGLEPLVKAVKGLGFNKEELLKLLRKTVKVEKHKHGDYILTPINEKTLTEDLDVGHQDNEPAMVKKQLYNIIRNAKNLYDKLGKYETGQEVDFPSWWQSKITKSQSYLSGAFNYLDSEEAIGEASDNRANVSISGINRSVNEGDFAYIKDEDYKTMKDLLQFIDDHADDYSVNPIMKPAVEFLNRLLREDTTLNEMLRHSVIAKHDGYQLVKKSNTPELTIAKDGKSVGNFKTSGNHKEDIKQFEKMVKSGKLKQEGKYKSDAQRKAIYAAKAEKEKK